LGVGLGERGRVQPPTVECARAEVLDEHVGFRDEVEHGTPSPRRPQVELDRPLVAVHRSVQHRRLAGVEPPIAQLVTGAGAFHLDHVGTEVGEHAPGRRRRDVIAQLEDADSLERQGSAAGHRKLPPGKSPARASKPCTGLSNSSASQVATRGIAGISRRVPMSTPARCRRYGRSSVARLPGAAPAVSARPARRVPTSTPSRGRRSVRSSVALLPVAAGANGQPPNPRIEASSAIVPRPSSELATAALAYPVLRVLWKLKRIRGTRLSRRTSSAMRDTWPGTPTPIVSANAISSIPRSATRS